MNILGDDNDKNILDVDGKLYSWNEFENRKFYAKYPPVIKSLIKSTIEFFQYDIPRWYDKIYYEIKDRLWPWNVVKIKTLNHHFHDRGYILLHSMFQVLTDFIEKEKPFEFLDFSYDQEHINAEKELKELYHWWNKIRPCRKNFSKHVPYECKELLEKAIDKDMVAEEGFIKEDEEMMTRLIKIRRYLWT